MLQDFVANPEIIVRQAMLIHVLLADRDLVLMGCAMPQREIESHGKAVSLVAVGPAQAAWRDRACR